MPRRQPFQDGSPAPWFPSLSVILLVLAVGLVLVLDYRSAGRGEPAYVFGPTEVVAEAQAPPSVPLVELVKDSLAAAGFDATTIVEDKDETGQPRFRVPTALDRQAPLGRAFEKRLQKSLSRVVKKDKVESAGRVEFAWSVRRHPEESVLVVFDCPVPEPVAKKETKRRPALGLFLRDGFRDGTVENDQNGLLRMSPHGPGELHPPGRLHLVLLDDAAEAFLEAFFERPPQRGLAVQRGRHAEPGLSRLVLILDDGRRVEAGRG